MKISISINNKKHIFQPIEIKDLNELAEYATSSWYSLATYLHNRRNLANFEQTEAIGLDIDNDEEAEKNNNLLSLNDAIKLFQPYKHLIMTSKSHQREKNGRIVDRFRVILFLEEKVDNIEDFYATWMALKEKFPAIDDKCKDASRFWYNSPTLISLNNTGKLIPKLKATTEIKWQPAQTVVSTYGKGRLARKTIKFLEEGAEPGAWNDSLFRAAKDLQEQGYEQEDAVTMLQQPTSLPGNYGELDKNDLDTIASAYANPPRHLPRIDHNDKLRHLINQSHLIVDARDHLRTDLVNLETGERFDICRENIKALLNREEFNDFQNYRIIYAEFEYNPYSTKIIYDKPNRMTAYNMYSPPFWLRTHYYYDNPIPEGSIPPIIKDFLTHLTDNDKDSYEYILDWMSTALTSRNYTMLTAIADQGVGKGVLGHLLAQLFGESNFKKTRDEVFKKSFNAQLQSKRLVYIDELALTSKESHDRMKDMVNEVIEIEAKGKDAITVTNHASFYISSNHIDAIKLEPDDRRISAIELTNVPLLKKFTRAQIENEILKPENIAQFGYFLYNRKIERDMRVPFRSDKFEEMLEAGLTNWQRYILYDYGIEMEGQRVNLKDVQIRLRTHFPSMNPPGVRTFKKFASSFSKYIRIIQGQGEDRANRYVEFLERVE